MKRLLAIILLSFSTKLWAAPDTTAESANHYTFNPLGIKRDPFFPPENPDAKNMNELTQYDLNEMNLVAILTGMGAPQAMIVLPNGKTHIVQMGDLIGRHHGKVYRITANEVVVTESFRDYQNRLKTNLTNLVLAQ